MPLSLPAMHSLLPAYTCSPRPRLCIGWGLRPAGLTRSPAAASQGEPHVDPLLVREMDQGRLGEEAESMPRMPFNKCGPPAQALCESELLIETKLEQEKLPAVLQELPVQISRSQVEQLLQLVEDMANYGRLENNRRNQLTQALLQCLGVGDEAENAYHLSMVAWALVGLKPYLPSAAFTSACTAFARHSASSKAMRRAGWREWYNLLHGLGAAGMQCSNSPDLTWLCDQAVQLLPEQLDWHQGSKRSGETTDRFFTTLTALAKVGNEGSARLLLQSVSAAISQGVVISNQLERGRKSGLSMTIVALAKAGYTGSVQPLLESISAAIREGLMKRDKQVGDWKFSVWAAMELESKAVSTSLDAMGMVLWRVKEDHQGMAQRAAQMRPFMTQHQLASSLYGLARLGYLDSSVCSLADRVAKVDLTTTSAQHLANLLYARTMFLALSIHQAVSSGHSQLASEPQLSSMAAAAWRECSRWGADHKRWKAHHLSQLYAASQWLPACTGGQTSLAATPGLQELVSRAAAVQMSRTTSQLEMLQGENVCQLVQALAAAGYNEVQQAVVSQDGTYCTQLLVMGPGLIRGIAVNQSSDFMPDGSMSGVVAHAKLEQLAHFDAGVVVNKAAFDQLISDRQRAAYMREQVRASLPEAEAWRNMLKAAAVGSGIA